MLNIGIPLSGSMSAGFAVGFMKGNKRWINTMLLQEIAEQSKVLLIKE
jgi:hypothetical protein